MATDNDLFAPPSDEELYEAPSEAELNEDVLMGAPLGVLEEQAPAGLISPEDDPEKTGKISAFTQQAAPAATLGLSDVIAGAAGSAGQAYGALSEGMELPSKQELLETYYEAKGETAKRREKAFEDQPGASIAGMVAGGFASPIPGAAISKIGKAGKLIAKALPSFKGTDKIAKAGKLADKAKLMGDLDRYKTLKSIQTAAATKLATREGTKAGAISMGALGESRLLEGDVDGFVQDVLQGGTVGAVAGAGFVKGTQLTGSLIKKIPGVQSAIDSFRYGSKGIDLNEAEVNHEINKAAGKFIKDFNGRLNTLKIDKQKVLDQIDELGVTINTKSDLEKAKKVIMGIDSASERKRAQQFLDVLDDYLGDGKAYKKAKESLEKKIAKARFSDPVAEARIKQQKLDLKEAIESGKVPIESDDLGVISSKDILPGGPEVKANVKHNIYEEIDEQGKKQVHRMKAQDVPEFKPSNIQRSVEPSSGREVAYFKDLGKGKIHAVVGDETKALDASKLTTEQANRLKGLMNEYSALAKKESLPSEVRNSATEAAKMINEKINGAAESIGAPISSINKKISGLISAKERVGLSKDITSIDKENSMKAMAKFIAGIGDKNPVSDKNLVVQRLRKVDPKLAEEMATELEDLRRRYELTKTSGGGVNAGGKLAAIYGSVNTVWNKGWNVLGQMGSAPFRAVQQSTKSSASFLANKTLDVVEASPAQLQGLVNKIGESGNRAYESFAGPLKRALDSKPRTKQAIMYGLYQQPAFREMVDSIYTDTSEEE